MMINRTIMIWSFAWVCCSWNAASYLLLYFCRGAPSVGVPNVCVPDTNAPNTVRAGCVCVLLLLACDLLRITAALHERLSPTFEAHSTASFLPGPGCPRSAGTLQPPLALTNQPLALPNHPWRLLTTLGASPMISLQGSPPLARPPHAKHALNRAPLHTRCSCGT